LIKLSSFIALLSAAGLLSSAGLYQSVFAEEPTTKINYTIKIGPQKHLTNFTVCAGDEKMTNPKIIIQSPQEIKEIALKKVLHANTCQIYEIPINAKHANMISVEAI
jgi:hypothetical protein